MALEYLKQAADASSGIAVPEHLWVLDSQPGTVAPDMVPDVTRVLEAVHVRALFLEPRLHGTALIEHYAAGHAATQVWRLLQRSHTCEAVKYIACGAACSMSAATIMPRLATAAQLVVGLMRSHMCVQEVPLPVPSRKQFTEEMSANGFSDALVQWMASNLVPAADSKDGELTWAFDTHGATDMYASYRKTCYWNVIAAPPAGVTLHVLRAGASDRWNDAMKAKLDEALQAAAHRSAKVRIDGPVCCDLCRMRERFADDTLWVTNKRENRDCVKGGGGNCALCAGQASWQVSRACAGGRGPLGAL